MSTTWDKLRRSLGFVEPETAPTKQASKMSDTELALEYAPYVGMDTPAPFNGPYQLAPDNGIIVTPVPVTFGQRVEIRYNGLLAQSGADQVILHYGYGPGNWRSVSDVPMERTESGEWRVELVVDEPGRLSFCFKDTANNWDNNYGRNWSYKIHGDEQGEVM